MCYYTIMNTSEQLERIPESPRVQRFLLEKGDEFFTSFISATKKSLKNDQSFTTIETQYKLIWKPLMVYFSVLGAQAGMPPAIEAADQLMDSLYELEEKADTAVELGPDFIMAYMKSGLSDIKEFLEEVTNGEVIF